MSLIKELNTNEQIWTVNYTASMFEQLTPETREHFLQVAATLAEEHPGKNSPLCMDASRELGKAMSRNLRMEHPADKYPQYAYYVHLQMALTECEDPSWELEHLVAEASANIPHLLCVEMLSYIWKWRRQYV